MELVDLAIVVVVGYLLGAIPFGLIIGYRVGVDLRSHGSGKTGATNTLRVLGRRAAGMVFFLDALKGALAVVVARLIVGPETDWLAGPNAGWLAFYMGAAATASVAGHSWSIFIKMLTGKWGGGRGVSTSIGAMFAVYPLVALIGLAIGIAVIFISRYVSLGSIIGVLSGVALTVVLGLFQQIPLWFIPWSIAIGCLVTLLHHDNIERLMKGTERKFGQKNVT